MASDQDKFTLVFYGFLFLCDSNKVSCRDGSHEIHCEKSSTKMSHQIRIIIGLELLTIIENGVFVLLPFMFALFLHCFILRVGKIGK